MYSGLFFLISSGCNKIVEIPNPVDTITASQAFRNDNKATATVLGIYNEMQKGKSGQPEFSNGRITIMAGLSADELLSATGTESDLQFQNNTLQSSNGAIVSYFWSPAYKHIYYANAAIEGLTASATLSAPVKTQLLGEAKFLKSVFVF